MSRWGVKQKPKLSGPEPFERVFVEMFTATNINTKDGTSPRKTMTEVAV